MPYSRQKSSSCSATVSGAADYDYSRVDQVAEGGGAHAVVQTEVAGILDQSFDAVDVDSSGQTELLDRNRTQTFPERVFGVRAVLDLGTLVRFGDGNGLQEPDTVGISGHPRLVGLFPHPVEDALTGQFGTEPAQIIEPEATIETHPHGAGGLPIPVIHTGTFSCSGRGHMFTIGYCE